MYIKPETEEVAVSTEVQNQLYVEIDYTSDKERLQQLMKSTEKGDIQAEEMGVLEQEEDKNDMVEEEKEDELEQDEQEQWKREQEGQGEQEEEEGESMRARMRSGSKREQKEEWEQEEKWEQEGEVGKDENEGEEEEGEQNKKGASSLHFFDCIVQEEQKADANIVLSCLEASLHALKQKFFHVTKLIVQSNNAKNLAGKQTKLLLPYVCSAAGLKLITYYHNEAQSGKDVCDTHFSHQQTQVDAYLVQGDGGRKVSTPKQLAVALINTSVSNTTVLLVKPNFQVPYYAAAIPTVVGISEFYAAQYVTSAGKQQVQFYNCLGQKTPSACVSIPLCHACLLIASMDAEGINFTVVTVTLNSVSNSGYMQARKDENRYRKRSKHMNQLELEHVTKQREDQEALKRIKEVYPQCSECCLYHFNSTKLLEKHICCGAMMPRDVLSTAMQHANELLTRMDFSMNGASNLFGNQAPCVQLLSKISLLVGHILKGPCNQS